MNVSGILVVAPVAGMDGVVTALSALPGVEVHHTDRATAGGALYRPARHPTDLSGGP